MHVQTLTLTPTTTTIATKNAGKPRTVYSPCGTSGKTNHSTDRCYFGANAANKLPLRNQKPSHVLQKDTQHSTNESVQAAANV